MAEQQAFYTAIDLQNLLYRLSYDYSAARTEAETLFKDFAENTADIAPDAWDIFQEILDEFKPDIDNDMEGVDSGPSYRLLAEERFNKLKAESENNQSTPAANTQEQSDAPAVDVQETDTKPAESDTTAPDTPAESQPESNETQDTKIFTTDDLQKILDMNENPETRDEAISAANRLLEDFVNETAEVDIDDIKKGADGTFFKFLETFGTFTDNETGETKLTELGYRAVNRAESIITNGEIAQEHSEHNNSESNTINFLVPDKNQTVFDRITLGIYKQMGLLDAATDPDNMTPRQIADMVNSINLDEEQRIEYANKFIDKIIGTKDLFDITPPNILADAYTFTRAQVLKDSSNKTATDRYYALATHIDDLIRNFRQRINYFYSDPSNLASVYAGYKKLCDVRSRDLKETQTDTDAQKDYKSEMRTHISETTAKLEEVVAMYSQMWNLKDLKPEDAETLDSRWKQIVEKLKDVELTDELLSALAKYEFLDENGNPLPQFIDENGNPQKDFKPGYKLNPDGRLFRIISLAKTDVTMRNVADLNTDVQDMNLIDALFDRVPKKMAEISINDQVLSKIEENPQITEEEINELRNGLSTDGGPISDRGYQAALDAQLNQAAGFGGLVAQKVGPDKAIVTRPFEPIQTIDHAAITPSEKVGALERTQKFGFFKRMLKNFGAAAVMSAGLTFIGKATGIAYAGAAIGTAIGIGNMIFQGFKWRKEQKKAGKPYGLRAFFSDKRNWGPAVASGLGIAAVISMASGNPGLAGAFGIGAITVGGGSAAAMTYSDAINAGYTKGQAITRAIGVMGASVAGGIIGNAAMNGVANYVNNNTTSHLFQTEHTISAVPIDEPITTPHPYSIFTPNELYAPAGIGALGIYEPRVVPDNYFAGVAERARDVANHAPQSIPHENTDQRQHPTQDEPAQDGQQKEQPQNTTQTPKKRGFFGWVKDFTYNTLRTAKHGLQKIQQGVNEMRIQRIKDQNARASEKQHGAQERAQSTAENAKKLFEMYDGISLDQITETGKKAIAARGLELDKLIDRLAAKRLRLVARIDRSDLRQQHKIEQELEDLKRYKAELKALQEMGDNIENLEEFHELQNKIKMMDKQSEIDIELAEAKGRTAIRKEKGKGDVARGVAAYKGATDLLKEKLKRKQIKGDGEIYEAAKKKLIQELAKKDYTDEQLDALTQQIIEQTMRDLKR